MKKTAVLSGITWLLCSAGFSQVLYDINFETSDQTINHIVKTGSPPQYISNVMFGAPKVVTAFGGLNQQPLLFDSMGQSPLGTGYYYTQIELRLTGLQAPTLDLQFDLGDLGNSHTFSVMFDTPQTRRFDFRAGQVSFSNPVKPTVAIGSYAQSQDCLIDIHLNLAADTWAFYENGALLDQGVLSASGALRAVRFNYDADTSNTSGTAIDNLIVVIPEPGSLVLSIFGLGLFRGEAWCRFRSKLR